MQARYRTIFSNPSPGPFAAVQFLAFAEVLPCERIFPAGDPLTDSDAHEWDPAPLLGSNQSPENHLPPPGGAKGISEAHPYRRSLGARAGAGKRGAMSTCVSRRAIVEFSFSGCNEC